MTTNTMNAIGVVKYEISVLPSEMEMIARSAKRCDDILRNHVYPKKGEKKIYLDDDDIKVILAILECISHDYEKRDKNSIEIMLEEWRKLEQERIDDETEETDKAEI